MGTFNYRAVFGAFTEPPLDPRCDECSIKSGDLSEDGEPRKEPVRRAWTPRVGELCIDCGKPA